MYTSNYSFWLSSSLSVVFFEYDDTILALPCVAYVSMGTAIPSLNRMLTTVQLHMSLTGYKNLIHMKFFAEIKEYVYGGDTVMQTKKHFHDYKNLLILTWQL